MYSTQNSIFSPSDRIVFSVIAGLLLLTALAKIWMLLTDPSADVRLGISREVLWVAAIFEIALAAANLISRNRSILAFINSLSFTIFGIFATMRWVLGYESCGCSGSVEIPSFVFVVIDWVIVLWFLTGGFGLVGHPFRSMVSMVQEVWAWWAAQSAVNRQRWAGFVLFVAAVGALELPFVQHLWGLVLEKPAIVAALTIEGELRHNHTVRGSVTILNRSNEIGKVIGMDQSCRCFELVDDPVGLAIPANSQVVLPVVIKPNKAGPIHQRITLFLEHPKSFRVPINLSVFSKGVD